MQHLRDNEEKQWKMTVTRPFLFYFCKLYHGLYLCESLHFVLYAWSSYFALISSCVNITKLLEFKMAARPPFLNCLLRKVNQVID